MDKLKNVMKQNNGNVVIGAFEDDPALMNKEQYYAIRLPYEAFADGGAVGKEFFGTLRQIQELIRMLRNKEWTRQYYASTIAAFDEYHAGNLAAVHKVAGNIGFIFMNKLRGLELAPLFYNFFVDAFHLAKPDIRG